MKCPFCKHDDTKVTDSRATDDGRAIRRRRECQSCGRRFTTYEMVEESPLIVIKRNGSRELFDRSKILNGLLRASNKRMITRQQLEDIVSHVERDGYTEFSGSGSHERENRRNGLGRTQVYR